MIESVENLQIKVKAETQKGLEVVKEEWRARNEVITKTVKEMEQKAEKKTAELGKRIGKHEGETEEQLRMAKEERAKTNMEVARLKDKMGNVAGDART